jgi:hypothetical protein
MQEGQASVAHDLTLRPMVLALEYHDSQSVKSGD